MSFFLAIQRNGKTTYRALRAAELAEAITEATKYVRTAGAFRMLRIEENGVPVRWLPEDDVAGYDYLGLDVNEGSWVKIA